MSNRPERVKDKASDTTEQRLQKALQRIANLPYDAPAERARRIAVGALGGDPSTVPEAEVFAVAGDMASSLQRILEAYIQHVGEQEGFDFLRCDTPKALRASYGKPLDNLTDWELALLLSARDKANGDQQ